MEEEEEDLIRRKNWEELKKSAELVEDLARPSEGSMRGDWATASPRVSKTLIEENDGDEGKA